MRMSGAVRALLDLDLVIASIARNCGYVRHWRACGFPERAACFMAGARWWAGRVLFARRFWLAQFELVVLSGDELAALAVFDLEGSVLR